MMSIKSRDRGLTLVELVVVMLVLVALAGVLVPQFGNMVGRSHGASGVDNAVEITKAVQFFQASKLRQPNGLSVPINADGSAITNPGGVESIFALGGDFTTLDLDANANALSSLTAAGIATLNRVTQADVTANESSTFGVETTAIDLTAVASPENIVILSAAGITSLGLQAGNTYAVFGLGETCELVGNGMVEAPLHFPEGADGLPENAYARWLVVYQLDVDEGEAAKLVSVCTNDEGTASGLQGHLREYFEATE